MKSPRTVRALLRRIRRLERRIDTLESTRPRPGNEEALPPCRLILQDPGEDPIGVAEIVATALEISLDSARALVDLSPTDLPVPDLPPARAFELRTTLSQAGAIVSLFMRKEDFPG